MEYNFKCMYCKLRSYIDPKLFYIDDKVVYNCKNCQSLYEINSGDLGSKQ